MSVYIGLDIGTTHITALGLDVVSGEMLATRSLPNASEITSAADKARGRSEWDADEMIRIAWRAICDLVAKLPRPGQVDGIGVCGQMHGMCVVSGQLTPLTPFVGWQDQRGQEQPVPGASSYVERANELAPGGDARLATGYMGLSLFWLAENGFAFPVGATATFVSDLAVAWLTSQPIVTDVTNAESSGVFRPCDQRWDADLISTLGLPPSLFAPIRRAPSIAGHLRYDLAREAGLTAGIPVGVSVGDNQASFCGSVSDRAASVSLTIGTGGQLSAHTGEHRTDAELETRSYLDDGYLLVRAELCGGHAYALWREFFRHVSIALFGIAPPPDLYDRMNALAAAAPAGSAGLRCEPTFTGSRSAPSQTGAWTGLTPANLLPGHMTRALLEGLIEIFGQHYRRMVRLGITGRDRLVASGNALRRNELLCQIAGDAFQMPVLIPAHAEEAAYGAALVAAVAAGALSDLDSAAKLIRYRVVTP